MKKVRLGVVGCGHRGVYVGGLFQSHPRCEVTALMDLYPAVLAEAKGKMGLPDVATFTDFDTLLGAPGTDALYFACDPMVQADLACRAMEAGRHVCTDVPAAFTLDDCRRLVETVKRTGMKYQLMEQVRYWGFVDAWTALRERGELGHVCLAQGEYIHYERHWSCWTDEATGQIIYDIPRPPGRTVSPHWRYRLLAEPIYYLPHTLSPLLKILGDRVATVSCMGTRPKSYTYEGMDVPWSDLQYALMHTVNDTLLLVGAGFSLPHVRRGATGAHWYEVRGTKGSVESPRCREDAFRIWKPGQESFQQMDVSTTPLGASAEQATTAHGGADFKPVATFVDAILTDTRPPLDVKLACQITAPAIVAAESARRGGACLPVPDFQ